MVSRFLKPTSGLRVPLLVPSLSLTLVLTLGLLSGGDGLLAKKKKPPLTKSIRGHVAGPDGKSLPGAKVFVRNLKQETTTILVTDGQGLFSVYGLDPKLDYQVHAEYQRLRSRAVTVSSMLRRADNVLNFKLSRQERSRASVHKENIELPVEDGARVGGDWYPPPESEKDRSPAVLLLHSSGETVDLWEAFIEHRLLGHGLGVLNIDLGGHRDRLARGESGRLVGDSGQIDSLSSIVASALLWLQAQQSIDPFRIAVVGTEVGAELAFWASGKHENVRSAVVISGNLAKARKMADRAQDFQPHSILYIATQGDEPSADSIAGFEQETGFPRQTRVFEGSSSKGSRLLAEIPEASDLVVEWLRKTLK